MQWRRHIAVQLSLIKMHKPDPNNWISLSKLGFKNSLSVMSSEIDEREDKKKKKNGI